MADINAVDRVRALAFDVFGTVVDWRTSIIREGEALARHKGLRVDWGAFADAWRARYQPQLSRVRQGEIPFTKLDDLHRESLEQLLPDFGLEGLDEAERDALNRVWHRLDPWPDVLPGLRRLHETYPLATLSNGNVSLMVHLARYARLPWDAILGAEPTGHYKPQPECYRGTAAYLSLPPEQCMLVAAHNEDLVAAAAVGYRTAFVARPTEYGPGQTANLRPEHGFDVVAGDFGELADLLGC